MKIVKIVVTNSLGELDVFFPIVTKMATERLITIEVIFAKKELFDKFCKSDLYLSICDKLNVKVTFSEFFRRFRNDENIFKLIKWCRFFLVSIIFLYQNRHTDLLFSDYTDDKFIIRPLQILTKFRGRGVFAIPHGLAIQQETAVVEWVKPPGFVRMICFDEKTKQFHINYGYKDVKTVGYVKAFPEWIELLRTLDSNTEHRDTFGLVFCRDVHENYMLPEKFEYLLVSSYEAIREVFPDIKIVYKLHPRQNLDEFNKFCNTKKFVNFELIMGNPSLAVIGAKFAISTWSSAILDGYFSRIPSCEYFIEDEKFLELEPGGSIHKKDGFNSFQVKSDLIKWLRLGPKFESVEKMDQRITANLSSDKDFLNIFGLGDTP
ncbi:hypothetical protein OAC79_02990 [Amylibacter sp.]|nr:hypothetical protein [Amylibacter sp.]